MPQRKAEKISKCPLQLDTFGIVTDIAPRMLDIDYERNFIQIL